MHTEPETDCDLPKIPLSDGLNLYELQNGTCFSLDTAGQQPDFNINDSKFFQVPSEREYDASYLDYTALQEKKIIPIDVPFAELMIPMVNVDDEGFVKKEIIQPGFGNPPPVDSSVVVHYSLHFEGQDEPFDNTRLRGKVERFVLGDGKVIAGLDIVVGSMKPREVCRVYMHYSVAFGELGCLPRILPRENVMGVVELIEVIPVNINAEDLMAGENSDFAKALREAKVLHSQGNRHYKDQQEEDAIKCYKKAKHILKNLRLANETEETEMKTLLTKVHLNLGICYDRLDKPELTCVECKDVLHLNPQYFKAYFFLGRANKKLSNFDRAIEFLNRGNKLCGGRNAEFEKELRSVEEKKRECEKWDSKFAQKSLQIKSALQTNEPAMESDYEKTLRGKIQEYVARGEDYCISSKLMLTERKICEKVAKDLNIFFKLNGDMIVFSKSA